MDSKMIELREELAAKQQKLHDIFAQAETPNPGVLDLSRVTVIDGSDAEKRLHIKRLNDEMTVIGQKLQSMGMGDVLNRAVSGPMFPGASGAAGEDLGAAFVKSAAYTGRVRGGVSPEVDLKVNPRLALEGKTVMSTTAGWTPQAIRTDIVVPSAQRPVQVLDLLPQGNTSQANVLYMEETTFTSAAAETAEANVYPESALALTERTALVQKIATIVPVTDEQLDDVLQVQAFVNGRLTFMIRQRLDNQVINGNGTAPNLKGILNVSGIQTQAKGADPGPDAIFKALVKVRVTGRAFPSGIIMHPTDWQNVRLLRTAEGVYIWGSPSDSGPERMWGLPVAQSDAIAQGTAVVGDFTNFAQLVFRHDIQVQVGFVNDDFSKGKKSIRADVRCAFAVYRPAAFATVTGL